MLGNFRSITLEVISQICGYSQMFFWCWGMFVIPYECIRIKSSRGLSKDFMLNNLIGFTLMAFQDNYGFFSMNASYASEVHISDVLLSFCGCLFGYMGTVIVFLIPSEVPNNVSWFSIIPNSVSLVMFFAWWGIFGVNSAAVLAGSAKACLSLIAYIPQIILVYKNKTTKGWSMVGVWVDFTGGALAVLQISVDYQNTGHGTGFFNELNYGKFLLNLLSCACCLVFFIQHYCIYTDKDQKNVAVVRKLSMESIEIDYVGSFAEKDFVLSMSSGRFPVNFRDADAVLRTPMGSQAGRFSVFGSQASFQVSDKINEVQSFRPNKGRNNHNIVKQTGNLIKKVDLGRGFTTIKPKI